MSGHIDAHLRQCTEYVPTRFSLRDVVSKAAPTLSGTSIPLEIGVRAMKPVHIDD